MSESSTKTFLQLFFTFFFFALFSLPFRIDFKVFKWAADPSEVSPKQVFFRAFVAKLQLDFFFFVSIL